MSVRQCATCHYIHSLRDEVDECVRCGSPTQERSFLALLSCDDTNVQARIVVQLTNTEFESFDPKSRKEIGKWLAEQGYEKLSHANLFALFEWAFPSEAERREKLERDNYFQALSQLVSQAKVDERPAILISRGGFSRWLIQATEKEISPLLRWVRSGDCLVYGSLIKHLRHLETQGERGCERAFELLLKFWESCPKKYLVSFASSLHWGWARYQLCDRKRFLEGLWKRYLEHADERLAVRVALAAYPIWVRERSIKGWGEERTLVEPAKSFQVLFSTRVFSPSILLNDILAATEKEELVGLVKVVLEQVHTPPLRLLTELELFVSLSNGVTQFLKQEPNCIRYREAFQRLKDYWENYKPNLLNGLVLGLSEQDRQEKMAVIEQMLSLDVHFDEEIVATLKPYEEAFRQEEKIRADVACSSKENGKVSLAELSTAEAKTRAKQMTLDFQEQVHSIISLDLNQKEKDDKLEKLAEQYRNQLRKLAG